MADESLRQRGWSIHSSDDHDSRSHQQQRPRADTIDTEQSMTHEEKLHLLNSAFDDDDDGVGDADAGHTPPRDTPVKKVDEGGGEDFLDMFGGEDNDGEYKKKDDGSTPEKLEPPRKRRKTGADDSIAADDDNDDDNDNSSSSSSDNESDEASTTQTNTTTKPKQHIPLTQNQQQQLSFAKSNLSKWAARLFDPNRPRGLVEAPKVIPLNDEFLTAFGKREKEYDELAGREIEIDKTLLDVIDVPDSDDEDDKTSSSGGKKENKKDYGAMSECKVKIVNLSYKTTTATIAKRCEQSGAVVDVNLIVDDNGQSTGRAYVVFETHDAAVQCVSEMNERALEGRTLFISLAKKSSSGRKSIDPGKRKQDARYWERDISTKCNACGAVGHIAKNCPNESKPKPCSLCAELGHEMWSCPQKSVCFNCGLPGHVVRDCNQRRGLPERVVCTICFRSGHHRFECRDGPWNSLPAHDAVCMECGQKGHAMCSSMKWFFGLRGVTCFNCGMKGHRGVECRRPDVDECQKNADVAQREIDMAGTVSLSDQLSNQRSNRERESRDGRMRRQGGSENRARSMPPPRSRGNNERGGHRGDSRRRY